MGGTEGQEFKKFQESQEQLFQKRAALRAASGAYPSGKCE